MSLFNFGTNDLGSQHLKTIFWYIFCLPHGRPGFTYSFSPPPPPSSPSWDVSLFLCLVTLFQYTTLRHFVDIRKKIKNLNMHWLEIVH